MCTYNAARFLDQQLASLVSQRRLPDEVVVCDDCSTDETHALLSNFAATAPFPVNLRQNKTRLGSTKNFEQAITLCQGDAIALCDQDDEWLPDKLASTIDLFESRPEVALVFCDAELIDEIGALLGERLWERIKFDSTMKAKIKASRAYEILDRRVLITGLTMAFRAKFRDLVLPFPENGPLIHDGWIALMISHVADIDFIDKPLARYRQHSSQQLGAPLLEPETKLTVTKVIESARRGTTWAQQLRKAQMVRSRMDARSDTYNFIGRDNLENLLTHFGIRESATKKKLVMLPYLFRELVTGRYHQYSNGFGSLIKDLLGSGAKDQTADR
jgi:glycosyltransferase involved in cell wall biosynthesis